MPVVTKKVLPGNPLVGVNAAAPDRPVRRSYHSAPLMMMKTEPRPSVTLSQRSRPGRFPAFADWTARNAVRLLVRSVIVLAVPIIILCTLPGRGQVGRLNRI